MIRLSRLVTTGLFMLGMAGAAAWAQAANQVSLSGIVAALTEGGFTVTQPDGKVKTVSLAADARILSESAVSAADIRSGDALGVAAKPGESGKLSATVIRIFTPELWNVVRKGQFPMADGQMMTNALVDRVAAGMQGNTLFMKYGDLSSSISLADGVKVFRLLAAKPADIKPGLQLSARGTTDAAGNLSAVSVTFVKN